MEFRIDEARRCGADALGGFLPERFPLVSYGRDRPEPPANARVLAQDVEGRTVVFQLGEQAIGFVGHPGIKAGIVEDLVMEFDEAPEDPSAQLERLRMAQCSIEDALVPIMTGIVKILKLMD